MTSSCCVCELMETAKTLDGEPHAVVTACREYARVGFALSRDYHAGT